MPLRAGPGHRFQGQGPAPELAATKGRVVSRGARRQGWGGTTDEGAGWHPQVGAAHILQETGLCPCRQVKHASIWNPAWPHHIPCATNSLSLFPPSSHTHITAQHGHRRALQSREAATDTPVSQKERARPRVARGTAGHTGTAGDSHPQAASSMVGLSAGQGQGVVWAWPSPENHRRADRRRMHGLGEEGGQGRGTFIPVPAL